MMYQHQHAPLPLEELEGVPQPLVVLLEALLEKDPGRRFQNPGELLKAIPTITERIEAGRRITRRACIRYRLQLRAPGYASHQQDRDPRKFQSQGCPLQEVRFLVERRISLFWMMHGPTSRSMS